MSFDDFNSDELLDRPLWQLTCREFCALMQYAAGQNNDRSSGQRILCTGVQALAKALGCSPSKIYALMRVPRADGSSDGGGILRDAIVSRIGRAIVFDPEKARSLATSYTTENQNDNE